uniref:Uncharacterized protein n=2 Tax=Eptatretus burgeri TaxID=7764 RepID=A0A8C4QDF9_EPTBU
MRKTQRRFGHGSVVEKIEEEVEEEEEEEVVKKKKKNQEKRKAKMTVERCSQDVGVNQSPHSTRQKTKTTLWKRLKHFFRRTEKKGEHCDDVSCTMKDKMNECPGCQDVGANLSSGSQDLGLNRSPSSQDVGLNRSTGSQDVGLNRSTGSQDVGLNWSTGSQDVGLNWSTGSQDVGLNWSTGSQDVGLNRSTGSQDVGLNRSTGSQDVGLNRSTGSQDVGLPPHTTPKNTKTTVCERLKHFFRRTEKKGKHCDDVSHTMKVKTNECPGSQDVGANRSSGSEDVGQNPSPPHTTPSKKKTTLWRCIMHMFRRIGKKEKHHDDVSQTM